MQALLLINRENILDKTYLPENLVQESKSKVWLKQEAYDGFNQMNIAIQASGLSPIILVSGYRSYSYQDKIFKRKVNNLIKEGLSRLQAIKIAKTIVAMPGTSEHQTGLAIDVTSSELAKEKDPLIEKFEDTDHGKWLGTNADKYGFILRYPKDKTHITHITYEPWHYRYVGIDHATKIKQYGMCLEEYIPHLKDNHD